MIKSIKMKKFIRHAGSSQSLQWACQDRYVHGTLYKIL